MTERERHDFTAHELTDLRGLHEAAVKALRAANAALEESIRIQQRTLADQRRTLEALAQALGEATGRPRVAPPPSPSAEQIENDHLERRDRR